MTLCMLALNVIAFHRLGVISGQLRSLADKHLDLERMIARARKDAPLTLPSPAKGNRVPPEVIVVDEQSAKAMDAAATPATDGSVVYLSSYPGRRRP